MEPAAPLSYATPAGYATDDVGPRRLGTLIAVALLPGDFVDLPPRCIRCNAAANRQWRRTMWYFRRSFLWWLIVPIYGWVGLGISAGVSHLSIRPTAGLCERHWTAHRRWAMATTIAVVLGVALVVIDIALDDSKRPPTGVHWGDWVMLVGVVLVGVVLGGVVLGGVGGPFAWIKSRVLWPIWADHETALLAGAGEPFLDGLPAVRIGGGDGSMARRMFAPMAVDSPALSQLGLVCIPFDQGCRFRTITRTRFLSLPPADRHRALLEVYWDNLSRLHQMLTFCSRRGIKLYRMISSLFPMSDEALGTKILNGMGANLSGFGRRAERLGIRVLVHPDQFVVLSSETPQVVRNSVTILKKYALSMDLMGLPRTPWASMLIHGGKAGRSDQLVKQIDKLPDGVRTRLCLENDEYSYSAADILAVCRQTGVPMIFDNHHHVIKEKLDSFDDPSMAEMVAAARDTWPDPAWQVVHLSNGKDGFLDREHSELIADVPAAYRGVPWIEVEAKGKEAAIAGVRARVPWVDPGIPFESPKVGA